MHTLFHFPLILILNVLFTCGKFHTRIRLSGGSGPFEGNVEVYIKNEWKYICDDSWDIRDAKVVCRGLNYTKGIMVTKQ